MIKLGKKTENATKTTNVTLKTSQRAHFWDPRSPEGCDERDNSGSR